MQAADHSITFWNRKTAQVEVEQVYGDLALKWAYRTRVGQVFTDAILSRHGLSHLYGAYQASRWSRHKIQPFIQDFQIQMEEFDTGPFASFNDFFIRQFKPGARPFVQAPNEMAAFSEARYLAFREILPDQKFPVKGTALSAQGLLGDPKKAKPFEGGPMLLARLCPTDYHRFHFPDSGKVTDTYRIHGRLHSVNPTALQYQGEIFITNERHVSFLETQNFGKLAYIEVGALCVGRIVQTYSQTYSKSNAGAAADFKRGDEKGYFLFGASTVIVLGQRGAWVPDSDLLEQTAQGRETLIRLGERVGSKP